MSDDTKSTEVPPTEGVDFEVPLTHPSHPAPKRRVTAETKRRLAASMRRYHARVRGQKPAFADLPEQFEDPEPDDAARIQLGITALKAYGKLPDHLRALHDEYQQAIITDLGGESELSTLEQSHVTAVAQFETIASILVTDIAMHGAINTRTGKARSALMALLKVRSTQAQYVHQLGLKRRAKKVEASIESWIAANKTDETPTGE